MFLLFLASNGMADLHRELRLRTFERYHTLHQQLLPFVAGKVMFAVVMLLLCSAVMLGGGGLIFRISWQQPAALALLAFGYACFAAGLMAVLVALVPDERRAGRAQYHRRHGAGPGGRMRVSAAATPGIYARTYHAPASQLLVCRHGARPPIRRAAGVAWLGWRDAVKLLGLSVVSDWLWPPAVVPPRFREGLRA